MSTELFLILHGWGGNKPAHWQEHLVTGLIAAGKTVRYPKMPNPGQPDLAAWQQTLASEIDSIKAEEPGATVTILAHSLGCINWLHYVAASNMTSAFADRVLLVAPPYINSDILPIDVPETVAGFFPPSPSIEAVALAAGKTVIVASDNDDYATYDQSAGFAQKFGIELTKLSGAGHISPYYGYGEWPWVLDWCLRTANLPPVPRAAE